MASLKIEEELTLHVKKALSVDETAPKQKHVRACIVYTWDIKSSGSFWIVLKNHPIFGDEVVSFKALILFHKVIKDGHPFVLKDGIKERNWLDGVSRGIPMSGRGYGTLIKAYITYLNAKLAFHQQHPDFTGSFDYEDYVSLRGIEDPNEGFETISELLGLLQKLDSFQKVVFNNLRPGLNNECRIASLVPLIEESLGIYIFLVAMLTAMHTIIGSTEVLAPLRDKFKSSHYALIKFYYECSGIKYLTSLITIPKLAQEPIDFLEKPPTIQPKKAQGPVENVDLKEQERMLEEFERLKMLELERQMQIQQEQEFQQEWQMQQQLQQQELERQLQQQQELERQMELQRQLQMRQNQSNLEQQMAQQRLLEMQHQLESLKLERQMEREQFNEASNRLRQLESQLQFRNEAPSQDLKRLQDEVAQWKQKYEALANLYAQLRKEHLELLQNFKQVRDQNSRMGDDSRKEIDKIRNELKQKTGQISTIAAERDRIKDLMEKSKGQFEQEIARLQLEISSNNQTIESMSASRGQEAQLLNEKFALEKEQLENKLGHTFKQMQEMSLELQDAKSQLLTLQSGQSEENSVLQAGLDETLIALASLQQQLQQKDAESSREIQNLTSLHLEQLNKMMDNVLQLAIQKVDTCIYEFDTLEGNTSAAPEYILVLLEKLQDTVAEFGNSFVALVQGGDQTLAICSSNSIANAISMFLFNVKGALGGLDDIKVSQTSKESAIKVKGLLSKVLSSQLSKVSDTKRVEYIIDLTKQLLSFLSGTVAVYENLVPRHVSLTDSAVVDDIEAIVDREMKAAAEAIVQASKRLDQIALSNVHSSIIGAAQQLLNAVLLLIERSKDSQQEIVSQGKGSASTGAFYKKNHKWTDGLVSAAKSVAVAVNWLVECADGLVQSSKSLEQLIVAAQQVSVATTQLTAASRVKAIAFSKTQDRLEEAATQVRDATKMLVRAAKEASKEGSEQRIQSEISQMSSHQFKMIEMEQQVKVLEIEKELQDARFKLAEIRKTGYTSREEF